MATLSSTHKALLAAPPNLRDRPALLAVHEALDLREALVKLVPQGLFVQLHGRHSVMNRSLTSNGSPPNNSFKPTPLRGAA
ncbi:MAG: hypothetical protein KA144_01325 [Xanthomonadaceae bacterium]|nr:hypothetical protein [Xanthomonadaceae bacterium]